MTRHEALRGTGQTILKEGVTRGIVREDVEGGEKRGVPSSYLTVFVLNGDWR
jgi:hypothetical protein